MSDSPDEIQWYPAFCAAIGLELQENMEELVLTNHAEVEDVRRFLAQAEKRNKPGTRDKIDEAVNNAISDATDKPETASKVEDIRSIIDLPE